MPRCLPRRIALFLAFAAPVAMSCAPAEPGTGNPGSGGKAATATGGAGTGGNTPSSSGGSGPAGSGGATLPGSGGAATGGAASGGATPPATGGRGVGGTTGSAGRGSGGQASGTGGAGATAGATGSAGNSGAGGGLGLKNTPVKSEGCGKELGTVKTGSTTIMASDGMRREYTIDIPTTYDKDRAHKVIFTWHWINSNDDAVVNNRYYGLKPLAMAANDPVIFIAPQSNDGTWDDEDHVLFDDLLKLVKTNLCIDVTRVFATGFSFGGMITYSLSTNHQKDLRAVVGIAPANWNIYLPTNTHEPIAYMSTTGMGDSMCKWIFNDAKKEGAKWAAILHAMDNGCTIPADVPIWTSGNHVCYDFQGCRAGYPVKACTFNGGHTDNSTENGQNWIPTESWKFFSQF